VTTIAALLLAFAAIAAVADWVAVQLGNKWLEYVAKPGALVLLIGVAITLTPDIGTQRAWFVAALVFCLAGDVFLMLPRDLFVPGLASFLVGHVLYIAGFGVSNVWPWVLGVMVVTSAVGSRIFSALRPKGESALLRPVAAYMAAITVMVACAIGSGNRVAAIGAVLFMVSDSLIAWNKFVVPLRWAPVAIMVLYHLGQGALVLSLVA
jgi:uncharacterized membrane protein YhhN